jgi:hypothetical protein
MISRWGLQVIPVSDEAVVVKRGLTELLISGAGAVDLVRMVVASLNDHRSETEVLDRVPGQHKPNAEQLLAALRHRGLVGGDAEVEPPTDGGSTAPLWVLFEQLSADPLPAHASLTAARVLVRGLNAVSAASTRGLLDLGVGAVDALRDPLLDAGEPDDWASAVEPELGSGALGRVATAGAGTEQAWPPPDLELACGPLGLSDGLLQANAAAVVAGRPFLAAWVEGSAARVGPLVVPHESACLQCASRQPNIEDIWYGEDADPTEAVAAITGHLAAMEALKFLTGYPPSDAIGRSLRFDTGSWHSSARRILKLPRCSVCSDLVGCGQPAVLLGPQIPMRGVGLHE